MQNTAYTKRGITNATIIMMAVIAATIWTALLLILWAVRDLNPRPPARHAGALAN